MKSFILLCTCMFFVIKLNAQTYFEQDFNSSSSIESYVGVNKVRLNNFDGIETVGNSSVEIFNNKLRIIKRESDQISRVGISRKTLFKGMPEQGAKFLKYSMEVTVSGNTKDIPDGFAVFFVKELKAPKPDAHAPGQASGRHSFFAIDPRSTEGNFRVRANGKVSHTLSGTQTIVCYINNSGETVSYKSPDNSVATLGNDELDLWAVDKDGLAEPLIFKVPAKDPNGLVRNFKIACNPNFAAILDIDNILIVEEPRINN